MQLRIPGPELLGICADINRIMEMLHEDQELGI